MVRGQGVIRRASRARRRLVLSVLFLHSESYTLACIFILQNDTHPYIQRQTLKYILRARLLARMQ